MKSLPLAQRTIQNPAEKHGKLAYFPFDGNAGTVSSYVQLYSCRAPQSVQIPFLRSETSNNFFFARLFQKGWKGSKGPVLCMPLGVVDCLACLVPIVPPCEAR